jgi:hypothetical protein
MSPEAAPRRVGQRQVLVGAARNTARALFMQRESRAGGSRGLDRHTEDTERNKVTSNKRKLTDIVDTERNKVISNKRKFADKL